jgi:hypothetical protein
MSTSRELDNLVGTGLLKKEPPAPGEVDGLKHSGLARLADASNSSLAIESRSDLAYNAAHALALAALRRLGLRSDKRYIVFQALEHTLGIPAPKWRTLAKAHENRNRSEYEGDFSIDERLVEDVIAITREVARLLAEAIDS